MFGAGLMIIAMVIAEIKLKFPADIKVKRLKD